MTQNEPFTILSAASVKALTLSQFRRKAYPYWCFEYVCHGAGSLCIENETFQIKQGDVYLLPKGLDHHYGSDEKNPWQKHYLVVDGPLISALLKVYHIQDMYHFVNTNIEKQMLEFISLVGQKQMQERAPILFHEMIQIISAHHSLGAIKLNSLTAKIKNYLDKSVTKQINLEDIANQFNTTKPNIIRAFKKDFQTTPYEYFISKKIDVAKYYLIETDMRIKEIAERLSFHDEFHLSKLFKQKTGITPKKFKTLHIQKDNLTPK